MLSLEPIHSLHGALIPQVNKGVDLNILYNKLNNDMDSNISYQLIYYVSCHILYNNLIIVNFNLLIK